jgi:hypothetical protein
MKTPAVLCGLIVLVLILFYLGNRPEPPGLNARPDLRIEASRRRRALIIRHVRVVES